MDIERVKEFVRDFWTMMLDYWWLTIIVFCVVFPLASPAWIVIFGVFKLVSVSKEKHKYDD